MSLSAKVLDPFIISMRTGLSNLMKTPIWTIAGVGAIGTLIAGHFCKAGIEVQLLLKNEAQLNAYLHNSLTLHLHDQTVSFHPSAVLKEQLKNQLIDHLICCVKAFDALTLLSQLKDHLHERSIIIMLHNGLGVLDEITSQLPALRIISGITTMGAYLKKPFNIHTSLEGHYVLGPGLSSFSDMEISEVCASFQKAKLPHQWDPKIQTKIWEKFAVNCCINMLTALLDCKNGDLMAHQHLLKRLAKEVSLVVSSNDIHISPNDLFQITLQIIEGTAENYSSMVHDMRKGQKTEIKYLNQYLSYLAEQKRIETPLNNDLLHQFYLKLQGNDV